MKSIQALTFVVFYVLNAAQASQYNPLINKDKLVTNDGVALTSEWTLPPKDKQPKAVLILLPGSGNVGLDGDVSNPFLGNGYHGAPAKLSDQLVQRLATQEIATYRYAKRGVEDSNELHLHHQTLPYLVHDAEYALNTVRSKYPNAKVGFVGFSEGATIALIVAAMHHVDALFLMGLPTKPIDTVFEYQFEQWGVGLLQKLDQDKNGELSTKELSVLSEKDLLPWIGEGLAPQPWTALDVDHNGSLSIEKEVKPAYQKAYERAQPVLNSPDLVHWYQALQKAPIFEDLAKKITEPVYLYQARQDAQVNPEWIQKDYKLFTATTAHLELFDGGHCFAPMDGAIGQIKTSGPFSEELLTALSRDVQTMFK
jgi:dienelactone hydrolase